MQEIKEYNMQKLVGTRVRYFYNSGVVIAAGKANPGLGTKLKVNWDDGKTTCIYTTQRDLRILAWS